MKLFFALFAVLSIVCSALPASAENGVSVYLYKSDATAPEGFTQTYAWRMEKSDEFRRFEYLTGKMKKGEKAKINPYLRKPAEMIVLSVKDENGITGKDYYLTPDGIMITARTSHNKYYADSNDFYTFLKEETLHHPTFEKFPGEKIDADAPGLVVRYLINEMLSNPAWLINTQANVNLYDSFLRKLPAIEARKFERNNPFDGKGNFVLMLNYPKAPAKFATVNARAIMLSDTFSEDSFVADEKKYYKLFYDLTQESKDTAQENEKQDREKLGKEVFRAGFRGNEEKRKKFVMPVKTGIPLRYK